MSEGSPGQAQPAGVSRLAHHLERMVPAYAEAFTPEEVAQHALMADRLTSAHQVDVLAQPLPEGAWRVTVVGYDYPGVLSLICGLLFVHGFTIRSGHVFTYEPLSGPGEEPAAEVGRRSAGPERRKIVDAFTVYPVRGTATEATWLAYANELADYVTLTARYQAAEARGDLAKRVAAALNETPSRSEALHPIDIEIDNQVSASYTVLWLSTEDTPGFLYEFTNALALSAIEISRVVVASEGNRVRDAFYLTDRRGQKITSPQAERELRAATVLVKHFTHLLPLSPNPESALLHFREFLEQLFARPDWPDELASLERREVLAALARLLGVSDFLWEDFMRMQYANLFPVVRDVDDLAFGRTPEELRAMLAAELDGAADYDEARERLNAFKDRETFRVDMRHIQGHLPEFGQFSAELSDVVEAVVEAAYALCYRTLVSQYGAPMSAEGAPGALTVCVLGKLGGREIGYASDIELMFIYDDNGMTAGPQAVSSADFWNRLVTLFLETIRARREGIFDIDLRLRPYGSAGSLAVPLASFRRYFGPGGPAWDYERQAIVKLRPLCGDAALGAKIASLRDAFVFAGQAPDIAAMRAMRERQMRHLVSAGTINCKFSPGGLVDIEYLVQSMQRRYGHEHSDVRVPNTRLALRALFDADLISQDDYAALAAALGFMRDLIDALRVERGNARDLTVPPVGSEAMAFLARRLGYGDEGEQLYADVLAHSREVQARSERLLATL
jgi:glutamate-ammonia-ligase adenylyltransferase